MKNNRKTQSVSNWRYQKQTTLELELQEIQIVKAMK